MVIWANFHTLRILYLARTRLLITCHFVLYFGDYSFFSGQCPITRQVDSLYPTWQQWVQYSDNLKNSTFCMKPPVTSPDRFHLPWLHPPSKIVPLFWQSQGVSTSHKDALKGLIAFDRSIVEALEVTAIILGEPKATSHL
ncbi:Uncharacterized protein TCM_028092 [Theobroma cacao]|uniref:Uncharacterized protein n=1 Tax=Theobroma cacao TaxID=3641 RepID=A0A061GAK1_THECC|nr:Uncharacterized protein TCM_028092 [Theobroma cacao]